MKIAIIGYGAIAGYVREQALPRNHQLRAVLVRPARQQELAASLADTKVVTSVDEFPADLDLVIDCAGHGALHAYGAAILRRGTPLLTVSLGALADEGLRQSLEQAATDGGTRLHLATGAIGALDCLRAARVGELHAVTYVGRKPPRGWKGSPAETRLDLDNPGTAAATHFTGSARVAATEYPKNANVAAAVALAGLGFDDTQVELIADPTISENIHEVRATGDFGSFHFEIRGNALPGNPRSSALAAMSIVSALEQTSQSIVF